MASTHRPTFPDNFLVQTQNWRKTLMKTHFFFVNTLWYSENEEIFEVQISRETDEVRNFWPNNFYIKIWFVTHLPTFLDVCETSYMSSRLLERHSGAGSAPERRSDSWSAPGAALPKKFWSAKRSGAPKKF